MNSEAMMKICYKGRMTMSASLLVIVMAMDLIARAQDTRFVTPGAWDEGMINPPPCPQVTFGLGGNVFRCAAGRVPGEYA